MFCLSIAQKVIKTFVFEKQETQQSVIVDREIQLKGPLISLHSLIESHCPSYRYMVSIYDPDSNKFVSLYKIAGQSALVPRLYLMPAIILFRYRCKQPSVGHEENVESNFEAEEVDRVHKDIRSKERTIEEVILLVKRWRDLHKKAAKPNNSSKRMNLQEAALEIGISKKSLDDYYCQLRLAQLYKFDFSDNMHERMGKLRGFVKRNRVDLNVRIRHHKHPMNLKLIDQYQFDNRMEEIIKEERLGSDVEEEKEDQKKLMQDEQIQASFQRKNIFNVERQYYRNFEYIFDDPNDPFLIQNPDCPIKYFDEESFNIFL